MRKLKVTDLLNYTLDDWKTVTMSQIEHLDKEELLQVIFSIIEKFKPLSDLADEAYDKLRELQSIFYNY